MEKFTKQHTNICKGVAICIMLFHHLFFRQDSWPLYYHKVCLGAKPLIGFIATHGKVCVAIFVLLSAYGLTFSMMKNNKKVIGGQNAAKIYGTFVGSHILKLYELYWPVFVPAMVIGLITKISSPIDVYNSFGECLRDFFGVAYIYDGETPFCGAWWYISFAITLYLTFPFFYKLMEKYPKLLLAISFIVGIKPVSGIPIVLEWKRYMFICCLGIYLAQHDLLSALINVRSKKFRIGVSFLSCVILFGIRCIHAFTFDGFLALSIIVFSISLFDKLKHFREALISLGKHSGTMFLLHGLLYKNFFPEFIYGFWYPPLIFIVLLAMSYILSVVVDQVKVKLKSVVIDSGCA